MTASDRLLPSLDLVQRVLSADAAYTISRMQVLEQLPGNPIGIAYRWMDETVVALAALPAIVYTRDRAPLRARAARRTAGPLVSRARLGPDVRNGPGHV